jgi:hypothetical protein
MKLPRLTSDWTWLHKQIDRQYERRWTAILPAIGDLLELNPFNLIESLFGGGSFRDVDIRIAELELRVSDLVRRRAKVTVHLHDEVTDLVLEVERGDRLLALLESQYLSQQQRVAVMETGYRTGSGNTAQMISLWQQTENLEAQLTDSNYKFRTILRHFSDRLDCQKLLILLVARLSEASDFEFIIADSLKR